jgi:leader peptidase (prepilin peptidase)/N-methyltransferase
MLTMWFIALFVLGAAIGSFLNVCIYRLPLEKSLLWPSSHCSHCLKPIQWRDNIPLLSYWLLGRRCRHCGQRYSFQYFAVELFTAVGFVLLFWWVVVQNVHAYPRSPREQIDIDMGLIPWQWWAAYAHHLLLFCFLIVASVCDMRSREIPLAVTLPGAAVGLVSAVLWPWPWPYTLAEAERIMGWVQVPNVWQWPRPGVIPPIPPQGLYPWPVWGPLPDFLAPGDNWQTGLATGLVGMLVGSLMVRGIRFVFSTGLGVEALGLGDADILMMAGCFLGWQVAVVSFFVSVFIALPLGLAQLIFRGDNAVPLGPSLAVGVMLTWLCWLTIAPTVQFFLFNPVLMLVLGTAAAFFMALAAFILGKLKRPAEKAE